MLYKMNNVTILVVVLALLGIFCHSATAQDSPSTPLMCNQTNSMDFDATQLSGVWWEVARNPGTVSNFACVKVNFTSQADNVLQIATTYSNTPDYPWVNQTMTANITVDSSNTDGYNISYVNGLTDTAYTVFKLLATDYDNYAFICGYQNITNNATYFGIVLTRERAINSTVLNSYEAMASSNYSEFLNGTMSQISQSDTCYLSGAVSTKVPLMSAIFAVIYAVVSVVC